MCMMLYMGSDNELPVIKWSEDMRPLICVTDIPEEYVGVRNHFTKKYQYAVYAMISCGFACGLRFDEADEIDDISERDEKGRKALSKLFDYIKEFVSDDNCELVSCWSNDEEKDLEYKSTIKINKFNWKSEFYFLRGQYIMVCK